MNATKNIKSFIDVETIEKYKKLKSSYIYFLKEQEKLKKNKSRDLFSGCSNMFGGLSEEKKTEILAYINQPTEKQWNELYSVIICNMTTLWQAWVSVDFNAPRMKDGDKWYTFPDGEKLIKAIREKIGDTDESLEKKVEKFQKEYLLLEQEYPALKTNKMAQVDYLDDLINPKEENRNKSKSNVINLKKN